LSATMMPHAQSATSATPHPILVLITNMLGHLHNVCAVCCIGRRAMSQKVRIDVWSDIACPWCYIGKRRLERAIEQLPQGSVEVVWHSFELEPGAPREHDTSVSLAQRLAKKYGTALKQSEAMMARVTETARGDGLDLHFEKVRSGNTFDAHRVVHLGAERGKQDAVKERMFRAYMTEGERIGDRDTLVRLGKEAGLDEAEVRQVLASDAYANEVREDEAMAKEIGINGVPFFVIASKYAVSGAQPTEVLLGAIEMARKEQKPDVAEGAACGPEACN
jgi:predicted DsbA family dithiol-disulfide isomerase